MTTHDKAVVRLKRTPLYEQHRALGARLVEFGGWEMPVQYSSILEEHQAVRTHAGLFDVSHMGEFKVEGAEALAFLQYLVPNDVSRLAIHQALYTQLCLPNGGTIDDLLIYRLAQEQYMLVVQRELTQRGVGGTVLETAGHIWSRFLDEPLQTYSTVTDFARLRRWSTSVPINTAA